MTYLPEINKRATFLNQWIIKSYDECVSAFSGLPGAKVLKLKVSSGPAVFVPGTRTDRILLVSHYDTIPGDTAKDRSKIDVRIYGTRLFNAVNKVALGADDRAGVAALWALRKSGHSLLIVPDEEIGCIGSGEVAAKYSDLLKPHNFAIQFDRRNGTDLVYYGDSNTKFHKFCEQAYPFYTKQSGTFSDICELCPVLGFSGLNVSIGFRNEHTSGETLDILEWCRTVEFTRKLLARKTLPAFEYTGQSKARQKWKSDTKSTVGSSYKTYPSSVYKHGQPQATRSAAWGTSDYVLAPYQNPLHRDFQPHNAYCEYVNTFGTAVKCSIKYAPEFTVFKLSCNGQYYLKATDEYYWSLSKYDVTVGKLTFNLFSQMPKTSQAKLKALGWDPSQRDPLYKEPETSRPKAKPLALTTEDDNDLIIDPKDYDSYKSIYNKMCPDCALEYQPDDIDSDGLCYICQTKLVDCP